MTGTDALLGLGELQASLSASDARDRATSFTDAAKYIGRVSAAGGIGFSKKSFPAGPDTDVRVDVEVLRGRGLTPGPRTDAIARRK